jgi:zinc transport system ATP-binding protein
MIDGPVILLRDVSFSYEGPPVLERITLAVEDGEFLGVVGPNAGGKSTLLKIILGLLEPGRGEVRVLGRRASEACHQIGYVPQYPEFRRDFPISVEDTVAMGRLGGGRPFGRYRRADREIVRQALVETEISDLAERRISTLSGGQLQRVMVARALACQPRILILDEPTANIDMRVESDIFDLLRRVNERMTIVVVSHDIAFISRYVKRVACLNRTLLCHQTAEIDGKTIQELYGSDVRMVEHGHRH